MILNYQFVGNFICIIAALTVTWGDAKLPDGIKTKVILMRLHNSTGVIKFAKTSMEVYPSSLEFWIFINQ